MQTKKKERREWKGPVVVEVNSELRRLMTTEVVSLETPT